MYTTTFKIQYPKNYFNNPKTKLNYTLEYNSINLITLNQIKKVHPKNSIITILISNFKYK